VLERWWALSGNHSIARWLLSRRREIVVVLLNLIPRMIARVRRKPASPRTRAAIFQFESLVFLRARISHLFDGGKAGRDSGPRSATKIHRFSAGQSFQNDLNRSAASSV
jgi:hypothetical protein